MTQNKQPPHPAAVAQEFMKRTDMKGNEVEAYAQTFNWLQGILEGEFMLVPAEAWKGITEELQAFKNAAPDPDEDIPLLDPEPELEDVDSGVDDTE
jgi:hypothetical protein